MATVVTVDQLTNLSFVEQRSDFGGVVFELRREALVSGLDIDALDPPDYRILQDALNALPAYLRFGEPALGHPDLILIERVVRLIPGERTKCIVELVYKRHFSTLDTLGTGTFIPRGGSGLRQFTTGKDAFQNDIIVEFTYPAACVGPSPCGGPGQPDCCVQDPDYPFTDPRLAGKTVRMGGEVQVDYPSDTLEFEGRLVAEFPGAIARTWRGSTNAFVWNDGAPGTWRCSEVAFYPYDIAPTQAKVWVFNFLFQFDPTGWNPDAIFRNQLTGMPPSVLIEGQGVVEVNWYPTLNFAILFPP